MNPMWFFIAIFAGTAAFLPMENLHLMVKHRRAKRFSLVVAAWQIFLFLLVVEFWTALVDVESSIDTIGKFLLFLLLPVGVMLMAQISKPDFSDDDVDEADAFLHQRAWFFGTLAALPIVSLVRELTNGESIAVDADLTFRVLILIGALVGLVITDRRLRLIHAIAMIGLIIAYMFVVYPDISIGSS